MTDPNRANAEAKRIANSLTGRDGNGRYAVTVDTVQRDAEAAQLRTRGYTYRQIATQLGVEVSAAHDMVRRAIRHVIQEPAEEVRTIEVERLDQILLNLQEMRQTVLDVLERKHYAISNGRLMYLSEESEEPLEDDDIVLRAVAQLAAIEDRRIKVQERRAKLLGLDVPVKQEVQLDAGVEYRIIGVNIGALS